MGMFSIKTKTSWQNGPTVMHLRDLRESFEKYPLIEKEFFKDIRDLCQRKEHYFIQTGLLQVVDPKGAELEPNFWILLWAYDNEERVFQLLIERNPDFEGRGVIAAAGPPDFYEFISGIKKRAILPLLGLFNTPDKIQKLGLIVSMPKSTSQLKEERNWWHALANFQQWITMLKNTPNVKGEWFPGNYPKCPECNNPLIGVQDDKEINKGHLLCPYCGYHREQPIVGRKRAASFYDLFRGK